MLLLFQSTIAMLQILAALGEQTYSRTSYHNQHTYLDPITLEDKLEMQSHSHVLDLVLLDTRT